MRFLTTKAFFILIILISCDHNKTANYIQERELEFNGLTFEYPDGKNIFEGLNSKPIDCISKFTFYSDSAIDIYLKFETTKSIGTTQVKWFEMKENNVKGKRLTTYLLNNNEAEWKSLVIRRDEADSVNSVALTHDRGSDIYLNKF